MSSPMIMSQSQVLSALNDPGFAAAVPELAHLRHELEKVERTQGRGCSSCRRRRVQRNVYAGFARAVSAMPDDAKVRLKRYMGVETVMMNTVDARTQQAKVEVF